MIERRYNFVNKPISKMTLDELWDCCEANNGGSYGHNIIAVICRETEERFGKAEATRMYNVYLKD